MLQCTEEECHFLPYQVGLDEPDIEKPAAFSEL